MIKLIDILNEEIELISRRSPEERALKNTENLNKEISSYIKNGSKGDLNLSRYALNKLPNKLKFVGGNLDVSYSKIKQLPNGLKIEGSLNVVGSDIEKLPDDIEIGTTLYSFDKLKSLPENLKLKKNLILNDSEIEFLPKGLEVNGRVNIVGTKIKIDSLPKDIKIDGSFSLRKNQLGDLKKEYNKNPKEVENKIREMYPGIKGDFFIG